MILNVLLNRMYNRILKTEYKIFGQSSTFGFECSSLQEISEFDNLLYVKLCLYYVQEFYSFQ